MRSLFTAKKAQSAILHCRSAFFSLIHEMSSRNSRKSKRRKYDTFLCSPGQLKAKKKYFRAAIIEAIRRDSRLQATLSHKVFGFFLWLLDTLYPCHSTVCTVHRLTIVLGQTMEKIHQSIPNGALSFIRTAD